MVDEFARLGHTVLGCGRSEKGIEALRRRFGPPHDFAVVDVASDVQVKAWADRLLGSHGPPDLVLNNAGVINKNARLWEVPEREFSLVIDVNIKGIANVIRRFAPPMVGRKRGVFVRTFDHPRLLQHFRISAGTPADTDRAIEAVHEAAIDLGIRNEGVP